MDFPVESAPGAFNAESAVRKGRTVRLRCGFRYNTEHLKMQHMGMVPIAQIFSL
jgi:hypothetical protein